MTAAIVVCFVALVLRRLFAPRVSVSCANGVWIVTFVGVFSRRDFVRRSANTLDSFPFAFTDHCEWFDMRSGAKLGIWRSIQADGLVTVEELTKSLHMEAP